jgi:hypothetical protein
MHTEADKDYFLKRARECRDQANHSVDVGVRSVHREMVLRYVRAAREIVRERQSTH